jgi:hypothetical protein
MKKYLLIGPDIVANPKDVVDIKKAIDWVDSPDKATKEDKAAAKVTQDRLAALGVKTVLVEIPNERHGSQWVICKED